jgi:hypothetical protein
METVHFKTIDPLSQDLLQEASRRGLDLTWDRYEQQQPQDGFLRLGLSCPYGCLRGPCRIDPYGRGADRGICGLDRDGMAAAFLLRLAFMGAAEALACHAAPPSADVSWPAPLQGMAGRALTQSGGAPLRVREVADGALALSQPSAAPESLVRQAVRLSLLSVALATSRTRGPRRVRVGYGLLAGEAALVGVAGRIPASRIQDVQKAAAAAPGPEVRLVSLGDWVPAGDAYLPIACTSGEAETGLSSGKLHALLVGAQADPALSVLGRTMQIPVLGDDTAAPDIVKQARASFDRRTRAAFDPDAAPVVEATADPLLPIGAGGKAALLGGSDSLLQSLGHLPTELARALAGNGYAVGAWGDAAVWLLKQQVPASIVGAGSGPLDAVEALASAGALSSLAGICFTGLKSCRELSQALGLATLGLRVAVAVPLPLWGSETVRGLLAETLAAAGGSLTHLDHPATADELLDWFLADGGFRQGDA